MCHMPQLCLLTGTGQQNEWKAIASQRLDFVLHLVSLKYVFYSCVHLHVQAALEPKHIKVDGFLEA